MRLMGKSVRGGSWGSQSGEVHGELSQGREGIGCDFGRGSWCTYEWTKSGIRVYGHTVPRQTLIVQWYVLETDEYPIRKWHLIGWRAEKNPGQFSSKSCGSDMNLRKPESWCYLW
jgi:hypothetical protein